MSNRWFYAHADNARLGPYTADEMRSLAISGDILRTDTIWVNDRPKGVLATRVQDLFPAAPVVLAPPPAPVVIDIPAPAVLAPPPPAPRVLPPVIEKKRRAIAGAGASIVGQDGTVVRFRKKCTTCKHEDSSYTTMKIITGTMNANFFCPKCRKRRDVQLRGIME